MRENLKTTFFEAVKYFALFLGAIVIITAFLFFVGGSLSGCATKWKKADCNKACNEAGFKYSIKQNWDCSCGHKPGVPELEL